MRSRALLRVSRCLQGAPRPRLVAGLTVLIGGVMASACGSAATQIPGANDAGPPGWDGSVIPDAQPVSDAAPGGPSTDGAPEASAQHDGGAITPPTLGGNVGPGGVTFRVWAPGANAAAVQGDFTTAALPMAPLPGGVFEVVAPTAHAGSVYAFVLQTPAGTLTRTDPYCRQLGPGGCVVVDPSAYPWTTSPFTPPPRNGAVVYELHVGSFSVPAGASQGTFASTRDALAGLADLGVNVVELMPVQQFGGSGNGWGYNPQLYFAPHPAFGTSDDFRSLVDRAHALGIAVWVDTVVNHMDAWKQAPLRCYDGNCPDASAGVFYFPPGTYATTPWGPRPNYPDSEVSGMLVATVDSWMGEQRVDGFRWDSVSNIRAIDGSGTTPGGTDVLMRVNAAVHAHGGTSVAEDLKGYAAITQPASAGGFGFDAQWDGFGYEVARVLTPASDSGRDLGAIVSALQGSYAGDAFARLTFIEDHDTVGNGGSRFPDQIDAADPTSFAARKRTMLAATLLLTAPGVPMLFMGEESLATGTFPDPATPLAAPTAQGLLGRAYYRDLIRLRRNLDGMSGGLSDDGVAVVHRNDTAKVLGYTRTGSSGEEVLVVVNLANKAYTEYDVGVADAAPWRIRVNSDLPAYGSDFTGSQTGSLAPVAKSTDGRPYSLPLALGAYSATVLTR